MSTALGNIKIYFGKVVSVKDESKLFRCQIQIAGFTEQLPVADLPWYYPYGGLRYLPIENDIVPVMIFDDNFSTGFYGVKVNLKDFHQSKLGDDDYKDYLEIFKRQIDDSKNVQLTYTKSLGIEFYNNETGTKIEEEKYLMFVKQTSITITEDRIDVGSKGLEASLMGDKTVKHLHNIIKHQQEMIQTMYQGFTTIQAACVTPMTIPIGTALAGFIPTQAKLLGTNAKVNAEADTIQSKLVYNG